MAFFSIFLSNSLLSALSIANLGLISSMVGFLLDQKHHVPHYKVAWPNKNVELHVLPEHLWVDHGHTSNGVAGYGFFLGLFGLLVAFRQRHRQGKPPSKTLLALCVLQFLAVLFTLSALIFVFLVTNQTQDQHISSLIAQSNVPYPADKWTPETWYKAVLSLPLADHHQRDTIAGKVTNMVAWRWMLVPIFLVDVLAFGISMMEVVKQRKEARRYGDQTVQVMSYKSRYMSPSESNRKGVDSQQEYVDGTGDL
ncbi:hypothetical protein P280DRAFT_464656 [Massarina eburnea CBS 473.64]|uniref:Uncharacterized protein n=1 Tax=Massarina eburnea CBS 473.64 TaxID=1395130 RepID=A0A6A6SEV7_9PLEO|nr:hypothetical protein P280DRAFT_464656 [Massarina eburnea CBS 473.64]